MLKINDKIIKDKILDPSKGLSLDEAIKWFSWVVENMNGDFFTKYKEKEGHEWADEDLKALLVMLTRERNLSGNASLTGYRKLSSLKEYHTVTIDTAFETDIIDTLRICQEFMELFHRLFIFAYKGGDYYSVKIMVQKRKTRRQDGARRFFIYIPVIYIPVWIDLKLD